MQLQDENQLTLIVLKVKGVIASFSCVMISFFGKQNKKKYFRKKRIVNKIRYRKKKSKKFAKKEKKNMKNKSQNSRKKRLTVLRYGT